MCSRSIQWFTHPKTQMALSALHLEQGLEPSHLLFFSLHRSQALHTRLRMPSVESREEVLCAMGSFVVGEGGVGDMLLAVCEVKTT